jgi:hypothetical protein
MPKQCVYTFFRAARIAGDSLFRGRNGPISQTCAAEAQAQVSCAHVDARRTPDPEAPLKGRKRLSA